MEKTAQEKEEKKTLRKELITKRRLINLIVARKRILQAVAFSLYQFDIIIVININNIM